jgi:hypothetical protein
MKEITNIRLLWFKGGLFVLLGLASSGLILLESPQFKTVIALALAIWAFCRAYYFAFYVIEHYADPQFRFSGLFSFLQYEWKQRLKR